MIFLAFSLATFDLIYDLLVNRASLQVLTIPLWISSFCNKVLLRHRFNLSVLICFTFRSHCEQSFLLISLLHNRYWCLLILRPLCLMQNWTIIFSLILRRLLIRCKPLLVHL